MLLGCGGGWLPPPTESPWVPAVCRRSYLSWLERGPQDANTTFPAWRERYAPSRWKPEDDPAERREAARKEADARAALERHAAQLEQHEQQEQQLQLLQLLLEQQEQQQQEQEQEDGSTENSGSDDDDGSSDETDGTGGSDATAGTGGDEDGSEHEGEPAPELGDTHSGTTR